jgi:lysophospholipase L1-like esterase
MTLSGTNWNKHCGSWNTSSMYFKTGTPITITATMNDGEQKSFSINASSQVQSVTVSGQMTKVKWSVSGAGNSTQFYGTTLDPQKGVVVDNFAMRGSAGMSLAGIPEQTMKDMAAKRPYDLLVLQFGLNATGPRSTQKSLQNYVNQMTKVINMLKRCYPNATIMIVSMSDRDQRVGGQIKTMKGVEELVSYQQMMAADNKVVFFNLWEAMGGNGGISKMAQQGMAGKDYTHINFKGGAYVAKKLFDGIMAVKQ